MTSLEYIQGGIIGEFKKHCSRVVERATLKLFRERNCMPLVDRFNKVTGLIVGATLGGIVGNYLGNLGLGLVVGASLGLLLGQLCCIKAERKAT